ncbi:MAG: hypothetical protein HY275_04740 [Gemmatimonadetes bacterium]|nr:hypothetical protein [Gemmatimonadota bacterium]
MIARAPAPPLPVPSRIPPGAIVFGLLLGSWVLTSDWLVPAALGTLLLGWRLLREGPGTPVLAVAWTYQFAQVASGLLYVAATGDQLDTTLGSDWRPMVELGLLAILALAAGMHLGMRGVKPRDGAIESALTWKQLIILYVIATALAALFLELTVNFAAFAGLYQGAVFLAYGRLAVLYLLFRRLLRPRLRGGWFALVLAFEVTLGLTSYFASFREVIIIAALSLMEAFDRRRAAHWLIAAGIALSLGVTSLVWTGIKGEFREAQDQDAQLAGSRDEKVRLMEQLAGEWFDRGAPAVQASVRKTVDRLWQVYYPSFVLKRVPAHVDHTGGTFLANAIIHVITPRFFFSDKGELLSDSDKVRKYAGLNVAGSESNTSIAFGYVAESYVDFGSPLMFVPIFGLGFAVGWLFRRMWRLFVHVDIATGATAISFWLAIYLYERSWDRTLGVGLTTLLFIGGAALLLDRLLVAVAALERRGAPAPSLPP